MKFSGGGDGGCTTIEDETRNARGLDEKEGDFQGGLECSFFYDDIDDDSEDEDDESEEVKKDKEVGILGNISCRLFFLSHFPYF